MKRRLLPIPLILLIPIVLLVVVIIAGVYRFSLDDEEILAKFPAQAQSQAERQDSVMQQVFALSTPNPWTISVPESHAFALVDHIDAENHWATGRYDSGSDRGQVSVSLQRLVEVAEHQYVSVMTVSNQGSGVFYYLTSFEYDLKRQRLVLIDTVLLGDRIAVDNLSYASSLVQLSYRQHGAKQSYADLPADALIGNYRLDEKLDFISLP
ncbi:hypothetical protein VII00023_18189 [Vibrio ichthyoenteri ATCC 700023]|uniref:Uncharacterized protein n=1 Tax=Vibrio ichthyoenteri ATCC 700023 TaxID=870968 RepID=F9RX53_9VIBR|nr:hypothetical protein [Vibrio ichthyoenteri]EGU48482.1 hypothetical protein VII00023_18189 [Vibrio ichthyoenteri ATCC 700023]